MGYPGESTSLKTPMTATGQSSRFTAPAPAAWQLSLKGTGAINCTVKVEARNDPSGSWEPITEELAISGSGAASAIFYNEAPWAQYRLNVSAISGTGANLLPFVSNVD